MGWDGGLKRTPRNVEMQKSFQGLGSAVQGVVELWLA